MASINLQSGQGVQILKINKEHKYELDKEALGEILLQEGVRDHAVVVVSVAGSCRGGKSFLLDFFLRYLYFKYARSVSNGRINFPDASWLGDTHASLTGFSWRVGSKPDTTGLLLWSQPIHATLPSGEKVVILLMDTQGTFDSSSTIRDCSTIFALSTLLSSVQIYNIFRDIREDYLQHLELFAEYGRLVVDRGQMPFQKLKFLVRDWSCYYEYPFGANGGEMLLRERLEIKDNQAPELQKLRRHISSCFEDVSCFLMPYPGDAVASNPNFSGKLVDIQDTFKHSLNELVPLLFEPQNLVVKHMNGQIIKAKDLYHCFETYLDEFNSGNMQTPMSMTMAMAKVGIGLAKEQAKTRYYCKMENVCDTSAPSLPSEMLRQIHSEAVSEALRTLETTLRHIIGNSELDESHLTEIEQELGRKLSQYECINAAKISMVIVNAKSVYKHSIQSIGELGTKCLHPQDLEESHNAAVESAMRSFDSGRTPPQAGVDEDRLAFLNELAQRFNQLRIVNETANERAVSESREIYYVFMDNLLGMLRCANQQELERNHEEARTLALGMFASMRSRDKGYQVDSYLSQLKKDIEERFTNIENLNRERNESAVEAALFCYNTSMGSICHPQLPSLHPEDFRQEHDDARDAAFNEFHGKRLLGENVNDNDEHKQNLTRRLSTRYEELYNMNESNNERAVRAGITAYDAAMVAVCPAGQPRRTPEQMVAAHTFAANNAALRVFFENRRTGPAHSRDRYRDNLLQAVEERFSHYQQINNTNPDIRAEEVAMEAEESSFMETALVVAGTAAIAAGVTAAVVATGGLAAAGAGAATAAGTVVSAEGIGIAATTAAGIAATVAATTWNTARGLFNRMRRRRRD